MIPLFAIGAFAAFTLSQAGMVAHWRKLDRTGSRPTHRASMAINAVGAVSTGLALIVVLLTKFIEGAWIVLLLIPALFWLFTGVHRHYAGVRAQTDCTLPLSVADLSAPVVVVVMRRWSTITRNALRFALSMSDEVVAVHVASDDEEGRHLAAKWRRYVEAPLQGGSRPLPRLVLVDSPYRLFLDPLFDALTRIADEHPGQTVAVVVPELAGGRWFDYLLHNQRSTALKAALLLRGDGRIAMVNVPWHLERR